MRISDWSSDVCSSDLLATLRSESVLAVQVTQARLRGGEGNATDALAARAEAASLDNRLEAIDADLVAAQAGLQRWLGPSAFDLADTPDFGQLPVAADHMEQRIDQQAPQPAWPSSEERRVGKEGVRT